MPHALGKDRHQNNLIHCETVGHAKDKCFSYTLGLAKRASLIDVCAAGGSNIQAYGMRR